MKFTNSLRTSLYTTVGALLLTLSSFAQAPEKMSYQAVIRGANNALVTNQQVGMQISILQGSTAVYEETQTPTSNKNGLVSLEIGKGTIVSGIFSSIDWSADMYFIKIETDPAGGSNYTITGTSQLLSVPYALYAKTSSDTEAVAANTAKVGITTEQATAIVENTSKTGITTQQADAITTNTAKVGYTEALVSANTNVAANTAKASMVLGTTGTTALAGDTPTITTDQKSAIIANTADIATKVSVTDIVDDLTTGGTTAPLSAEQGKVLKGLVDSSVNIFVEDVLTSSNITNALSANQGKVLKAYVDANSTNANLTGMVTSLGNTTTVVTNANLTGDVTSVGNTTTIGTDKVVSSMILDGTIVVGDLADDAVETAKIKDANVTDAKIATVSASKLRGTVGIPNGGTSHTSYTQGDILYATSATTLAKLPKGTAGQVLAMNTGATAPEWLDSSGGSNTPYVLNTVNAELGGYVIEVNSDGTHGLVVAMQDQGVSSWYNADNLLSNPSSHDTNGAKFKDWRLPSKRELNLIYSVYLWGNGASLNDHSYWISTTYNEDWGMTQNFADGNLGYTDRGHSNYVRAVRAF